MPDQSASAIGSAMPAFTALWRSARAGNADVAGRWLLVATLPRGDRRCRDMQILLQVAHAIGKRRAMTAIIVDEPDAEAALIGAMTDCRDDHGELMIISDASYRVATALRLAAAGGPLAAASLVVAPDGEICGLLRHPAGVPPPADSILAMFDALRAGHAGCTHTQP